MATLLTLSCGPHAPADTNGGQRLPATFQSALTMDQVRARLIRAGIGPDDITAGQDEEHDVAIWRLSPSAETFAHADKAALAQLALDSDFAFEFSNPAMQKSFASFLVAEMDKRDRVKAINQLRASGTLASAPRYDRTEPMTAFAARLEQYCGLRPRQALRVVDGQWLDYNVPDFLRDEALAAARHAATGDPAIEHFRCLKRIVDGTDLRRYFIGNRKDRAL